VGDEKPATSWDGMAAVLAGVDRIAVIDVETTGLYSNDRIVELAIVTMDAEGGARRVRNPDQPPP
jgi:DNA polymerase III epsilon subunit-like protein